MAPLFVGISRDRWISSAPEILRPWWLSQSLVRPKKVRGTVLRIHSFVALSCSGVQLVQATNSGGSLQQPDAQNQQVPIDWQEVWVGHLIKIIIRVIYRAIVRSCYTWATQLLPFWDGMMKCRWLRPDAASLPPSLVLKNSILVGGWPTPLKNDGVQVSGDDDIPNIWKD